MSSTLNGRSKRTPILIASISLLLSATSGFAQTWTGASSHDWNDPTSWGGTVPNNDGTAVLLFSASSTPLSGRGSNGISVDWDIHSITWNADSLRDGATGVSAALGTALTLRGAMSNFSGGNVTITANLILPVRTTWNDTTSGDLFFGPGITVSGSIGGTGGFEKTGSGKITIASLSNSYSGGTKVSAGILEVEKSASLGTGAISLAGGILRLRSATEISQPIVLEGAGGTIQGSSLVISNSISGVGGIRYSSIPLVGVLASPITLLGNKTYSGGTTVGKVTVVISQPGLALGSGNVTLESGAVLQLDPSTNLGAGQTVAIHSESALVITNASVSPDMFVGAASSGGVLAYSGVTINTPIDQSQFGNGKLFLGSASAVTYAASSLLPGIDGSYRLGGGSFHIERDPTLTLTGENVLTGNASLRVGDRRITDGTDYLEGTRVVLSKSNNYSGGTYLQSGTLLLGTSGSIGTGPIHPQGGAIGTDLPSLEINNSIVFDDPSFDGKLVFGGDGTFNLTTSIDLGGQSRVFGRSSNRVTFLGNITNGALRLENGSWALKGNNTFAGGLTVSGGYLDISSDNGLGAPGAGMSVTQTSVHFTQDVSISRSIGFGGGISYLDTQGHEALLLGALNPESNTQIKKRGQGRLGIRQLAGTISVEEGELELLDDTLTQGITFAVLGSGTILTGNGRVEYLTLSAGAHLSPGGSGVGRIQAYQYLTLHSGAVFDFDLGGTDSDEVKLAGNGTSLNGDSFVVNISDAGGLGPNQTYTLFDATGLLVPLTLKAEMLQLGNSPIDGEFSDVGNTIQFTTVPEPSAMAALAISLPLALMRRRRETRD